MSTQRSAAERTSGERARRQREDLFAEQGLYAEAASELRAAIGADEDHVGAHLQLGEALNQLNSPDEAITALQRVVAMQPDTARAYYAMGLAYDRKGQPDRAAEMYRLSLQARSR